MKICLGSCAALLLLCVCLDAGSAASLVSTRGGCLADGVPIPTLPVSAVNDLGSRINDIKNGNTESWKHFQNRESCLPGGYDYSEYRLYPSEADANRIVVQEENEVFYFTSDHYTSFYKISLYSYEVNEV